jgi:4-hydroxyphenylpyruvate dioxygenase
MTMMGSAIATVCLSGGLQEKLEAISAAGFRAVEIFENDLIAFNGSPADVRRMASDLGLKIITFQPFRDFEGLPPERRARTFERAERKFDLMGELDCDLLLVCSNVSPESEGGIDRLAEDFRLLGERAAKRGIRIGYEALAWGRYVNDYRDAWEIVRRANHSHVGTILDTFHILARGTELNSIRSIPRDKIYLVQVADAPLLTMDPLSWSRHWRCMPGQGDLDLNAFMEALSATGYDDYLSLEIFNDRFRAASARAVAIDGHRSLINLLDDSERRKPTAKGVTAIPPRAPVEGVEFIEFAVDDAERPELETLLAALGFARTGRHRSKDVALWRQGDIRIVVNSDKDGFAHSYQLNHGTSVCALGIRVPDAAAAIARASALLDIPYEGAIGPGELNIPAVRGLGGSLLYFFDSVSVLKQWTEVDFLPEPTSGLGDAGLVSVDHISQTMHYEEMLSWLLFYSSLFETRKTQSQAVVDPGGVVQSQVIESALGGPHGGLRLILNGSQSHRTQTGRFLNTFFGSGVQHIALSTDDIFKTAERFIAAGVKLLPVPENYYDDLYARYDLSDDRMASLKRNNILYDRDASGEFHQLYTLPLAGGFFFEIIERKGYTGYGAPNASIRLAAQARLTEPLPM